jgi:sugar (pentulose or hexulose) kinase
MTSDSGPLLCAIDVGTSGARAIAIAISGRVVAQARHAFPTRVVQPGWAEQDPEDWTQGALSALRRLTSKLDAPKRIVVIGLTGQCPTVAPFDRSGNPLGPGLLYRDNRAAQEAIEMRQRLGETTMHRRTGHVAEAFHIGPKVLWLRRHAPEVFRATARFLQPRDAVLRHLTGLDLTDETHANATLFFDLRARRWAPDLFQAFDLDPALFPEAAAPWSVAGPLNQRVAREVGIPRSIPVVVGAADSQCAAFGAGVVDIGPVSEMAGASSCLNSAVTEPLEDRRITHYSHVVPGRFCTELGVNTAGAAVAWARESLGFASYEALSAAAERFRVRWRRMSSRAAGALEIAPLFVPFLGDGERTDPTVRGAFIGLAGRHGPPELAYAVLEGVALAVRNRIRTLIEAGGLCEELRRSGGGARFAITGELEADLLGVPVLHLPHDTTALGVTMLAARAIGLESEASAAIKAGLARARHFEPSAWGTEAVAPRAAWFEKVLLDPIIHAADAAT